MKFTQYRKTTLIGQENGERDESDYFIIDAFAELSESQKEDLSKILKSEQLELFYNGNNDVLKTLTEEQREPFTKFCKHYCGERFISLVNDFIAGKITYFGLNNELERIGGEANEFTTKEGLGIYDDFLRRLEKPSEDDLEAFAKFRGSVGGIFEIFEKFELEPKLEAKPTAKQISEFDNLQKKYARQYYMTNAEKILKALEDPNYNEKDLENDLGDVKKIKGYYSIVNDRGYNLADEIVSMVQFAPEKIRGVPPNIVISKLRGADIIPTTKPGEPLMPPPHLLRGEI